MSEETKKPLAYKVKLSTGKVVHLREPKIKHTEIAAQAAASKAGENATLTAVLMQRELLTLLIVGINDRQPKASELEDLDELLTVGEYSQLLTVLKKVTGGDERGNEPSIELEGFGDK